MQNIDQVVGDPIVVGCLVTPKGRAKAAMAGVVAGGVVGSMAKAAVDEIVERKGAGASPLPANAFTLAYLAVTADKVVLVRARQGLLRPKAQEIVATAPRPSVVGADLGGGTLARPLVLRFADGVSWELEVPRANVKGISAVLSELGVG